MKAKNLIRNINPFNNQKEIPKGLYVVKKLLAFLSVQIIGSVIGEILVIALLNVLGYDPLNGDVPAGNSGLFLKCYGFAVFFISTLVYCKLVEKRNPKSLGFNKKAYDYVVGGIVAVLLLGSVVAVCCATGVMKFNSFTTKADGLYLAVLFGGFIIQSLAEEVMARGFLLPSLSEKTSLPLAVFVSSTAFAIPHLATVLESETPFAVVGIINLYLVSAVFSLLFVLRSNIYIVSGLHCVWNFVLYGVLGLSVSGSESNENALLNFNVNSQNILSGGAYGLEASVITTAVLAITAIVLVILCKKRGIKNGL